MAISRCFRNRLPTATALIALALAGWSAGAAAQQPVRVLTGDHPGSTRLVVQLPPGVQYRVEQQACGGRVLLSTPVQWPLPDLNRRWVERLSDFRVSDEGQSLDFAWPCGSWALVRRERDLVILDIGRAPRPGRKPATVAADASTSREFSAPAAPPDAHAGANPADSRDKAPAAGALAGSGEKKSGGAVDAKPAAASVDPDLTNAVRRSVRQALDMMEPDAPVPERPKSAPPKSAPPKSASPVPASPVPAPPVPASAMPEEPPPATIGPFDLAAWGGQDFAARSDELKKGFAASQGPAKVESALALARFYLAWAMPEEGRGIIVLAQQNAMPEQRVELDILDDAFRVLDGTGQPASSLFVRSHPVSSSDHMVWRAVALAGPSAGQGDWSEARRNLPEVQKRLLAYPPALRARLLVLLADAAVSAGDAASLDRLIMEMITLDGEAGSDRRLDYYRGRLAELHNELEPALAHYAKVAKVQGPFGRRAQLRTVEIRRLRSPVDHADIIQELEALRYAWRGDEIEADTLRALGEAYLHTGRLDLALEILGLLGQRFPGSSQEQAAAVAATGLVETLLAHAGPPAGTADLLALAANHARLLDRIDTEGRLRRQLALRLGEIGFTREAERMLRAMIEAEGPAAADAAADLAELLLRHGRPTEALRVLDSRPAAAPAAGSADRLRHLKGEALLAAGLPLEALASVRGVPGDAAARLRARASASVGEWRAAQQAYAELLAARTAAEASADDVARYGLAAFRAGDLPAVRAAATRYGSALDGTRWAGLFDMLVSAEQPASGNRLSSDRIAKQIGMSDALIALTSRWLPRREGGR